MSTGPRCRVSGEPGHMTVATNVQALANGGVGSYEEQCYLCAYVLGGLLLVSSGLPEKSLSKSLHILTNPAVNPQETPAALGLRAVCHRLHLCP
jgi:hypothetical protein